MKKVLILLLGFSIVLALLGGCQSSSGSKKKDVLGKDFKQRVAEDPFPYAGAPLQ